MSWPSLSRLEIGSLEGVETLRLISGYELSQSRSWCWVFWSVARESFSAPMVPLAMIYRIQKRRVRRLAGLVQLLHWDRGTIQMENRTQMLTLGRRRSRIPWETASTSSKPLPPTTTPSPHRRTANITTASATRVGPRTPRRSPSTSTELSTCPNTRWRRIPSRSKVSAGNNNRQQNIGTDYLVLSSSQTLRGFDAGEGWAIVHCRAWASTPQYRREHQRPCEVVEYVPAYGGYWRGCVPGVVAQEILRGMCGSSDWDTGRWDTNARYAGQACGLN